MTNEEPIYKPEAKVPENDLNAIAEVSEDDVEEAIADWVENFSDSEFKNILKAESSN